jgi:hypothetical protein
MKEVNLRDPTLQVGAFHEKPLTSAVASSPGPKGFDAGAPGQPFSFPCSITSRMSGPLVLNIPLIKSMPQVRNSVAPATLSTWDAS